MFLKPFSSFSFSFMQRDGLSIPCLISKRSSSFSRHAFSCNYGFNSSPEKMKKFLVSVSNSNTVPPLMEGFLFQPFEEVKKEDLHIPEDPQLSLGRQYYSDECEIALNEQINVEYSVSYVYHAMFAYFDRDNIALRGLAKFFKESSGEEREHAEKLIRYQNIRGGKVKLHSIMKPPSDYEHEDKGDALYAMELALSLEKLTNEKLLKLHSVAERNCDPQLEDFIEKEYLEEQVEAIKKISEFVAQLRRVGKGHGVWHFDQMLLHEEGNAP